MKVCLAGFGTGISKKYIDIIPNLPYILESFYYIKKWQIPWIKEKELFLLDSGAFTFMFGKSCPDMTDYIDRYIKFINKYDVKHFFEMDLDNIYGTEWVEKVRARIERETGKKSIPVWHPCRGKQGFLDLCDNYDYIAVGDIVTRGIPMKTLLDELAPWTIATAHKYGCQIHGLGFTDTKFFRKHKGHNYDSVDSTSWSSGQRHGRMYKFTGTNMISISKGRRIGHYIDASISNLNEWAKYVEYAKNI